MMCALGASAAEAYANYTPSNTTLTFYYDNLRSTRTGTTYNLNKISYATEWEIDGISTSVTQVVFDSSFANARPTTTDYWFYKMFNLQSVTGMAYLNTSEVTSMNYMFFGCRSLTSLDLSHFNTAKVTDMGSMFNYCFGLTSLDLSSFNTAKVTDMAWMFYQSFNLKTIYVGDSWSTVAVTNSDEMFHDCSNLVGGQGTTYDSNHIDAAYAHIDGGPSNPGYFSEKGPEAYACYTPSNTTLTFYYDNLRSTRTGTTYDLNTGSNAPDWYSDGTNANVTKVVFNSSFANARPTITLGWFAAMKNLQSITGMAYLNTSQVTNMEWMFGRCESLTNIDLSHFNTANVTSMYYMFAEDISLTSLDVSHFNTSNVTNMQALFGGCESLTDLDVSNFNTSKVTDMSWMFSCCISLTSLDLSSFNTSRVTKMSDMFSYCDNLQTIYVGSSWSTAAVTSSDDMFSYCTSLVGGLGTTYDSSHTDAEYAYIDNGPYSPGYLTDINADVFLEDGIFYEKRPGGTTVYVTQALDNIYEEYIPYTRDRYNIPETVTHAGKTYTVTGIGYQAFFGCNDVLHVSLPTTLTVIEAEAFYDADNMESIYCHAMTPPTVAADAFSNWVYDGGVEFYCPYPAIDDYYEADVLSELNFAALPYHFEKDGLYYYITGDNTVSVSYKDDWFNNEIYKGSYTIPVRVTYQGKTYNVTGVYDFTFSNCDALTAVNMGDNITSIGSWAFRNCTSLTSMTIPAGVTIVENELFDGCTGLASVTIPAGVTAIRFRAFNGCTNLETITCYAEVPPTIIFNTFSSYTATLYVPASSVNAYKAANYWKNFYDIQPIGGTATRGDVNGDGNVNISDVTALINYLLSHNTTGVNVDAADCNQDNNVNISDVTALINYLLSHHW